MCPNSETIVACGSARKALGFLESSTLRELSSSSEAPPPKKNYGQTITLNRSLLLLPTLGPTLGSTLDISIDLCLALLIRFFEELDVLIVTVCSKSVEHL